MAKLVSITETSDAITATATAHVWEQYDAPRKRIPRVRIVEHQFTVSLPKIDPAAAPVAFIIEHFPEMTGRNSTEYRAGYDEPIRAYNGKFYTLARRNRNPHYSRADYGTARETLTRAVANAGIPDYTVTDYAAAISRDAVRADQWHQYSNETAESVTVEPKRYVSGLIVIDGDLWSETGEPAYQYHAPWRWHGGTEPACITVTTNTRKQSFARHVYGAFDQVAMHFYHANVSRTAYINVIRPDLVSIDSTAQDLAESTDRAHAATIDAKKKLEDAEARLNQARVDLEAKEIAEQKARENLAKYTTNPVQWWIDRAEKYSASKFSATKRAAERIRKELVNSIS